MRMASTREDHRTTDTEASEMPGNCLIPKAIPDFYRLLHCQMWHQARYDAGNPRRKTLAHNYTISITCQLFAQALIVGDTMHKILNYPFLHGGNSFLYLYWFPDKHYLKAVI